MDFSGRVLLLTGASGGIGAAIAQLFYQAGASVLLADVQETPVRELARELDPSGERTESIKYDASRPDDATAAVRLCLERFGKIDFLVPGAAIYEDQPFLTMTDEQWRKTLAINLDGVFYICRRGRRLHRPHVRHGQAVKVWPPEWWAEAPTPDGGAPSRGRDQLDRSPAVWPWRDGSVMKVR